MSFAALRPPWGARPRQEGLRCRENGGAWSHQSVSKTLSLTIKVVGFGGGTRCSQEHRLFFKTLFPISRAF